MTLTLNKLQKEATFIAPQTVSLINSLGGRALPIGQTKEMARVTLENFAATDIQPWQLNVAQQTLNQRRKTQVLSRIAPKDNPYMSPVL